MNFFRVAGRDIANIAKNRFIRVSVAAIIIVPLLYSLLYLYAFWDPYNHLQDLQVAVVNMDKGTVKDGEEMNYGNDLVDKLKDNTQVGWRFVSKEQAKKGLKDKGRYYAMFVVPEDFSAKVISAKDGKPQKPSILYSANEKKNFLAAQINGKVLVELKSEITKNIVDEYTKVTFDNLYDVKDGMQQASDGSKQIYDGIGELNDKVPELKNGVNKLYDGSKDLNSGLGQALSGTVKLADGASALNTGISNAKDGSNQLKDGLAALKGNIPTLKSGTGQLYSGAGELNGGIKQFKDKVDGALNFISIHPELKALINPSTISGTKQIMKDGLALKDADTSLLNLVPSIMTQNNMTMLGRTVNDVKAVSPNLKALKNDALIGRLPQLITKENINNINSLMNDTEALANIDMAKLEPFMGLLNKSDGLKGLMNEAAELGSLDTSKLSSLTPLLKAENAQELNNLLTNASNLSGIDLSKLDVQGFVNTSNALNKNKDALEAAIDKAYPTESGNAEVIAANKNLKAVVEGYAQLTAQTSSNLTSLAPSLNNLASLQQEVKNDKSLIDGAKAALTADNVTAADTMINKLDTMQSALNTKENKELMNTVNSALSKENVQYLQNVLPKLQSMQQDLAKNERNLETVKALLAKADDPDVQDTIRKVQVLSEDLNSAKPVFTQLESQLTDENMQKLAQTPQLISELQAMQKDLQNNGKILEVAQSALSDGNIKMAEQLVSAIPDLTDGVNRLYEGSNRLKDGLGSLNSNIPTLENGVYKLYDGSYALSTGLGQLYRGSSTLKSSVGTPSSSIISTAKKYNSGSSGTLMDGVNKLYNGSSQLKDGLSALNSSVPELSEGVNKLYDGSKELSDKLKEGSDKINKNLVNNSTTMADFVSDPISITEKPMYQVKTYGRGFTPYFIPLSLWVGALMMFFVITDDVDPDIKAGSASIVLGKFLSYGIIGIVQAVLASSIVLALGLKPANILLYYLFNIMLSLVFIAIIQSLIFLMGDAGRLLAIVLLILQLTACAGTFPLEVVPKLFKVLNPFMPFTYAVSGLREVISGIDSAVFMQDVTVLLLTGIVFLIISVAMKGRADRVKEKIKLAKEGNIAS